MADAVATVRDFNRFYTRVIGVLADGLLRTPYSLTEARVIFELAQRPRTEVTGLRHDLGLDPGYLSRMLGRFESDGLVRREVSTTDARRQVVGLTDRGREVFADLDRRSVDDIAALMAHLDAAERDRLLAAMGTVRSLLSPERAPAQVTLRDEALVARILADFVEHRDPARERGWIAERGGEPVGCVFCVRADETTAKLRLLLVEPSARGLGVGGRLVDECLAFAKAAGYRRITLWTNDVLTAARRIYERAGFALVHREPHRSYGHDLTGETWERDL